MNAADKVEQIKRVLDEALPSPPAITVETAMVDNRQSAPLPSQIPMPDHQVRGERWYQLYARLARPTLDWVGVMGAGWSQFLGDWLGHPMDEPSRIVVLTFVCALFGIRTFEKVKGVA